MTQSHAPSPIVPIQYTIGDVTTLTARPAVIARLCPDRGAWTHGVAAAISRHWPHVARDHRDWLASLTTQHIPLLGAVQCIWLAPDLWMAAMITLRATRSTSPPPSLQSDALVQCLWKLERFALRQQASVHMPRVGDGPTNDAWNSIEPMIRETLSAHRIPVTVYDAPPPSTSSMETPA